jgi:hypothetical protein
VQPDPADLAAGVARLDDDVAEPGQLRNAKRGAVARRRDELDRLSCNRHPQVARAESLSGDRDELAAVGDGRRDPGDARLSLRGSEGVRDQAGSENYDEGGETIHGTHLMNV